MLQIKVLHFIKSILQKLIYSLTLNLKLCQKLPKKCRGADRLNKGI